MLEAQGIITAAAGLVAIGGLIAVLLRRRPDHTRSEALFEGLDRPVLELDRKGRVQRANAAFGSLTGRGDVELTGSPFVDLLPTADRGQAQPELERALVGETVVFRSGFTARDGSQVRFEIRLVPIRSTKRLTGVFVEARDLSSEEQLKAEALHDHLTGLPNRELLRDRLLKSFQRARRSGRKVALLYFDLDRFRSINDIAGHEVGDLVLKGVAKRLGCFVREGDTVARLGGDEFAVLLEDVDTEDDALQAGQRVATLLEEPIEVNGEGLLTKASVGIAISTPETETPEELFHQADLAMYEAKRQGGHRSAVYTSKTESDQSAPSEHLEGDLRRALVQDELAVHYQPIVDLAGSQIVGAEALVRWNHPEHGTLPPSSFIPMAEESGLIVPLDRWVLSRACEEVLVLGGLGAVDTQKFMLSVNLSRRQLEEADSYRAIERILDAAGFDPAALLLEIKDLAAAASPQMIERLKTVGVKLAVDDFGTGHTSLAYLGEACFDVLKIDQSFVAQLQREHSSDMIVRTIMSLAGLLDLGVISEGVERAGQVERLREIGGRLVQGHFFAEALDFNEFETLCRKGLPPTWAHRRGSGQL